MIKHPQILGKAVFYVGLGLATAALAAAILIAGFAYWGSPFGFVLLAVFIIGVITNATYEHLVREHERNERYR